MLGVNSEQKESMQHYISDSIYGLTLAWITSKNSTKQLECRHLLTRSSSLDPIFSATVSGVDRISPCPIANSCQLLSPTNSLLASHYLFQPRWDFKSKNPLSGFAPKQTKESSAWRATYIVLQHVIIIQPCTEILLLYHFVHIYIYIYILVQWGEKSKYFKMNRSTSRFLSKLFNFLLHVFQVC